MPKKTESGDPLGLFNIHSVAKLQKVKGGPFEKKISRKKCLRMPKKTERGGPLASSGIVCYVGDLFGSVPWAKSS